MDTSTLPVSPFQKILFCTDFSENADYAFDFAVDSSIRRPGCTLYLLHVIPETDAQFWKTYIYEVENVDQKAKQDIDEKIDKVYRPRVPISVDLKVEMRGGKDYKCILDFADEIDADLIVIGRQGHSRMQKVLFGSVTEKIARKARCAVLIIPLDFQNKRLH